MKIKPGTAGAVNACDLTTFAMGDGTNKPIRVIVEDTVLMYVGIGWIERRKATQADADRYPVVIYRESTVDHRIAI